MKSIVFEGTYFPKVKRGGNISEQGLPVYTITTLFEQSRTFVEGMQAIVHDKTLEGGFDISAFYDDMKKISGIWFYLKLGKTSAEREMKIMEFLNHMAKTYGIHWHQEKCTYVRLDKPRKDADILGTRQVWFCEDDDGMLFHYVDKKLYDYEIKFDNNGEVLFPSCVPNSVTEREFDRLREWLSRKSFNYPEKSNKDVIYGMF